MKNYYRLHILFGWVIFLTTLFVYWLTLEPTVSFWDSGEFIASAYKLQIPHPPGPPLFLLIGRFFSFFALDNSTDIAFWVNMTSAVSSAGAVMFLYWIIVLLGRKLISNGAKINREVLFLLSGAIGSFTLAFSDTFWFSAVETEVYAMSTFFIAMVVWAILKLDAEKQPSNELKWILLIAYLMGLSIGVHPLCLLAIPTLVVTIYFKTRKFSWKGLFASGALGIILTLFMMNGFRVGLIGLIKNMEILFVNGFNFPFYSGVIFFTLLLVVGIVYGIKYSIKKRLVWLNTAILSVSFVIIGYSSYITIIIRSSYNPPIDMNNVEDIPSLINYLDMLQYGSRPLLYGQNFTSKPNGYEKGITIYKKGEQEYEISDQTVDYKYDSSELEIFPRLYSNSAHHIQGYRNWLDLNKGKKPTFSDNLSFFTTYQLGHMYFRYFMWNFAGKQGDFQDAGWLAFWENNKNLPVSLSWDKGRNNYFLLPFLLGIIGFIFHYKKNSNSFVGMLALFVITGIGLVVYLNSPIPEPRERDYIYIGSFFTFSIWIGLGVVALFEFFNQFNKSRLALIGTAAFSLMIPSITLIEGWDDHDRSDRYFTADIANNHLASCEENAILFTGGDNDTYPLWYAQEVEGKRTDVRIIVTTLFNTEWYVDQMTRQAYASNPLPFSFEKKDYKRGSANDYIPFVSNPNLKGNSISLDQYLRLLRNSHPALQVETATGEIINSLPSKILSLNVDMNQIKRKKMIPDTMMPIIVDRMNFMVTKSGLEKKDIMLLDLISTNNWERPIYFTYTALNNLNFDISDYVVQNGYTYRLLPVKNHSEDQYLVDSKSMYDNMMNKFSWNLSPEKDVYYTAYHKQQVLHARSNFNNLANQLIKEGELEKAKKVLYKNLEVLPDDTIPYDITSVNSARLFASLNEIEKSVSIASTMVERVDNEISYFINHKRQDIDVIRQNLAILNLLTQTLEEVGETDLSKRAHRKLRTHIENLNKI